MLGGAARVPGRGKDSLAQGVDVEGDGGRVPAQDVITTPVTTRRRSRIAARISGV